MLVNAKTYTADSHAKDAVVYVGPDKTVSVKDDLKLARTAPKATTTFSGVGRTEAKITRTATLTNALTPTGDGIMSINSSIPVGASDAFIDALSNDMGAYVASATFKALLKKQSINQ